MRDREHASEYLDFYLDVLEHEILCKAFVKDIKKIGLDVNVEYPDYERYQPNKSDKEKRFSGISGSDVGGVQRNLSNSSKVSNTSSSSSSQHHAIEIPSSEKQSSSQQTTMTENTRSKFRDSVRSS